MPPASASSIFSFQNVVKDFTKRKNSPLKNSAGLFHTKSSQSVLVESCDNFKEDSLFGNFLSKY